MKNSASKYFQDFIVEQLKNGVEDTDIRLPTRLGPLRDATPQYCLTAVDLLNRKTDNKEHVLGLKSWSLCRVKEWNLSFECINSREAMQAFLKMPQEFQDEVRGNINWTPPDLENLLEDQKESEEAIDAADVDFEVAALAAITKTGNDIQLPLGYTVETSTQGIQGGVIFEDMIKEKGSLVVDNERSEIDEGRLGIDEEQSVTDEGSIADRKKLRLDDEWSEIDKERLEGDEEDDEGLWIDEEGLEIDEKELKEPDRG